MTRRQKRDELGHPRRKNAAEKFSEWLNAFIAEKGMSESEASSFFEVSPSAMRRYVRGHVIPTLPLLLHFMDKTQGSVDLIFGLHCYAFPEELPPPVSTLRLETLDLCAQKAILTGTLDEIQSLGPLFGKRIDLFEGE